MSTTTSLDDTYILPLNDTATALSDFITDLSHKVALLNVEIMRGNHGLSIYILRCSVLGLPFISFAYFLSYIRFKEWYNDKTDGGFKMLVKSSIILTYSGFICYALYLADKNTLFDHVTTSNEQLTTKLVVIGAIGFILSAAALVIPPDEYIFSK